MWARCIGTQSIAQSAVELVCQQAACGRWPCCLLMSCCRMLGGPSGLVRKADLELKCNVLVMCGGKGLSKGSHPKGSRWSVDNRVAFTQEEELVCSMQPTAQAREPTGGLSPGPSARSPGTVPTFHLGLE